MKNSLIASLAYERAYSGENLYRPLLFISIFKEIFQLFRSYLNKSSNSKKS